MDNREDIYNKALAMIKAGHSTQDVLEVFSNFKSELSPLLNLSHSLLTMPKAIVPTPLMQRKYALGKNKSSWLVWARSFKFAAATFALVALIAAGTFTAYAAKNSLPGTSLFALKRAEEKTQLIFTLDPQAKANLEVALAQKRLDEAQQIFSDPSQNSQDTQTAALAELSSQTSSALAAAAGVTQTDPQAPSNSPLLNNLEDLTQKQQSLLKEIKSNPQIGGATQTALAALSDNTKQLSQIKQAVSIADNSQALAELNATSTSVTALGKIDQVGDGRITVEKITFSTNPQTIITDDAGNKLQLTDLSAGQTVNIVGIPGKASLIASTILVTDSGIITATSTAQTLTSSPTTTPSGIDSTSTSPNDKKVEGAFTSKQTDADNADSTPNFTSTVNLNIATGGFIIESPAPQFHQ